MTKLFEALKVLNDNGYQMHPTPYQQKDDGGLILVSYEKYLEFCEWVGAEKERLDQFVQPDTKFEDMGDC